MESMESQANETALVDDLLTADKNRKRREKRIRRARAAIVALKRCGYLEDDEEMRTWS